MAERVRINWSLDAQTPVGITVAWLVQQKLKDHGLEAMAAFWYPFALQSQPPEVVTTAAVPALTSKAEALLAISRLERQIALLRQTFLEESDPVSESLTVTATPAVVPATNGVVTEPTPVACAELASPLPTANRPVISGFESFDQSLSSGVDP